MGLFDDCLSRNCTNSSVVRHQHRSLLCRRNHSLHAHFLHIPETQSHSHRKQSFSPVPTTQRIPEPLRGIPFRTHSLDHSLSYPTITTTSVDEELSVSIAQNLISSHNDLQLHVPLARRAVPLRHHHHRSIRIWYCPPSLSQTNQLTSVPISGALVHRPRRRQLAVANQFPHLRLALDPLHRPVPHSRTCLLPKVDKQVYDSRNRRTHHAVLVRRFRCAGRLPVRTEHVHWECVWERTGSDRVWRIHLVSNLGIGMEDVQACRKVSEFCADCDSYQDHLLGHHWSCGDARLAHTL